MNSGAIIYSSSGNNYIGIIVALSGCLLAITGAIYFILIYFKNSQVSKFNGMSIHEISSKYLNI